MISLAVIIILGQVIFLTPMSAQVSLAKWTFMIYVAYDNNLGFTPLDSILLRELMAVGSDSNVNIVVLIDKPNADTTYYHIQRGYYIQRTDYPESGDIDTSNYQSLKTFIQWTASHYPASHYVLVLHNHGGGVVGALIDQKGNELTIMTTQDIRRALSEAGVKIDIVFFHACLMGMVEVATALWDSAISYGPPRVRAVDYMIASERPMSSTLLFGGDVGVPYRNILTYLKSNPTISPRSLAITIVEEMRNHDQRLGLGQTLSAIELSGSTATNRRAFGFLLWDLKNLAEAMERKMATIYPAVRLAIQTTPIIDLSEWHYVDLYTFVSNLKDIVWDAEIQSLCDEVLADLTSPDGPIIANYPGTCLHCHGLSIYIPKFIQVENKVLKAYNRDYDALDFSRATYWNGFIRSFYGYFDFRVNISPGWATVRPGDSVSFTVSVELRSGSASSEPPVVLMLEELQDNTQITYSLSPSSGRPPFTSTLTINVGPEVTSGYYGFKLYGISDRLIRQNAFYIQIGSETTSIETYNPPVLEVDRSNPVSGIEYWQQLPGTTLNSPSIATSPEFVIVAARGTNNGVYWLKLQKETLIASPWRKLSGSTLSGPSIAVSGNVMYIAVRGSDNGIYWSKVDVESGAQTPWRKLSGSTLSGPSIAVSGNVMYIAVRGSDNGIYLNSVNTSSGSSLNWIKIKGKTMDAPTLLRDEGFSLLISLVGENTGVYLDFLLAFHEIV
ncbi:MAG: clostripain-related cysteine peptidase [Nitrososphaerota archaeon]